MRPTSFVAFLAYGLHVTLQQRLRPLAPGLTPRAVLDKLAALQMVDVHLPTTDGRRLILSRYTQPEKDVPRVEHRGPVPDIIAYLQSETELTRSTLVRILKDSGRLGEFLMVHALPFSR